MMKKIVSLLLVICLVAGIMLCAPIQQADAAGSLTVTGSAVNVRTGPGTGYSKVGTAQKGAVYPILGSRKASDGVLWYNITFGSRSAWIISRYVSVSSSAVLSRVTGANGSAIGSLTVTAASAVVRTGAGTGYSKMGTVSRGGTYKVYVSVTDSAGTVWYKIPFGSSYGYVVSSQVSYTASGSGSTQATTTKPAGSAIVTGANGSAIGTLTITSGPVNVRTGAGTNYSKLGTTTRGKTYKVYASAKDSAGKVWYKIPFGSGYGYVISTYVSFKAGSAPGTAATTTANRPAVVTGVNGSAIGVLTLTGDNVNVRTGAGTNYSKMGTVSRGKTYKVYASAKDSAGTVWYKIPFGSSYGYVISSYVSFTAGSGAAATTTTIAATTTTAATLPTSASGKVHPQIIERTLTVSTAGNVYSDAGTNNSVAGSVGKGAQYLAVDWKNDSAGITWYAFMLGGKKVWISRKSVTTSDKYKTIADRDFSSGGTPVIYLSPSRQPDNLFAVGSTSEQEQMERVANALKTILENEYVCTVYVAPTSMPIEMYGRPLDAFTKDADVHLAIHSNANASGTSYGASAYYFPSCAQSIELSQNIVSELDKIAPRTSTLSARTINGMTGFGGIGYGDVRNPSHLGMIGVLAEVEYHDNADSAQWIINNTEGIARALANALETTLGMRRI